MADRELSSALPIGIHTSLSNGKMLVRLHGTSEPARRSFALGLGSRSAIGDTVVLLLAEV